MKKFFFLSATLLASLSVLSCAESTPTTPNENPTELEQEISEDEQQDADFIGLSLDAAQKLAAQRELRHRVINIDGEPQIGTKDYRLDRVNFSIQDGIVTAVKRG